MGHFHPDLDGYRLSLPFLQTDCGCVGAAPTKSGRLMRTREEALTSWVPIRAASQGDLILPFLSVLHHVLLIH